MNLPRLVLAAPMSGSGKTTLVAGLIAALTQRGLKVAPFKVGPDYIDPTYHSLASGRACRNLDAWMLPPDRLRALYARGAADADLSLIEGVMGLFDGYSGEDDTGSTAHVARLLDAPVLVILDVRGMARTAAALVKGLCDFDPRVHIVGVILNRVGSETHARWIKDAIESAVGIPVVGYLMRDDEINLPERHLGLVPTLEPGKWRAWLDAVSAKISATVNLDQVIELAKTAPPMEENVPVIATAPESRARIAVARDAAFNFLYEDNLDLLRAAGAELEFFSPLHDSNLPRGTQAIYLCGGFPEIYAAELAANESMRRQIRDARSAGIPIYAECGGLMYLTERILDQQNASHAMVGVLPGRSVMTGKLTLGYRTVRAPQDNWLWRSGETIRGHEFHYSTWERELVDRPAYELLPDASHPHARVEGAQGENLLASYVHLHFIAHPDLAARFVAAGSATIPLGVNS